MTPTPRHDNRRSALGTFARKPTLTLALTRFPALARARTPTRARALPLTLACTLASIALLGSPGCNFQEFEEVLGGVQDAPSQPAGTAIPFTVFTDSVGTHGPVEERALIRTAQGYQGFFGHAAPASVDFSREWVIFYGAGVKPTGGFVANISSLTLAGSTLTAITELVSPGSGCAVTQASTSPVVLIKFVAQPGSTPSFVKRDRTQDCPLTNVCAAVTCAAGSHCEAQDVQCVRAPCPPVAVCVPDVNPCAAVLCPTGTNCVVVEPPCLPNVQCAPIAECVANPPVAHCGGIAGLPCPGRGTCIDDPSDSCDPKAGGADCGGICTCVQNVACAIGASFNSSPQVCACVPLVAPPPPACGPVCDIYCQYGNVLDAAGCPTCQCKSAP